MTTNLINQAKEYLIMYHPFFAFLALQIEFIREDEVNTSSIDGITFRYNKDFLESHDHRWVAALMAAGMGKVLLLHPVRAEGKNIPRWNRASWFAVNSLLKKSGVQLVNELYNPKFDDLDTEQIYELLKDEEKEEESESGTDSDNDSGFMGFNDGSNYEDDSGDGSDLCKIALPDMINTSKDEVEAIITQKIIDAAIQSESCGEFLSDALTEIIEGIKEPKKNWRELLYKFTAELARNDYNWEKPDDSYLQRNIYIPGLQNEEIGGVIFNIDTSGSINKQALETFTSELKEALSEMTEEITVMQTDTEVRKVEQIQTEEVDKMQIKGRGGTSFYVVFDYIEKEDLQPKALIMFTDGMCYDVIEEPDYPVLWVIYENSRWKPQFGEVIYLD